MGPVTREVHRGQCTAAPIGIPKGRWCCRGNSRPAGGRPQLVGSSASILSMYSVSLTIPRTEEVHESPALGRAAARTVYCVQVRSALPNLVPMASPPSSSLPCASRSPALTQRATDASGSSRRGMGTSSGCTARSELSLTRGSRPRRCRSASFSTTAAPSTCRRFGRPSRRTCSTPEMCARCAAARTVARARTPQTARARGPQVVQRAWAASRGGADSEQMPLEELLEALELPPPATSSTWEARERVEEKVGVEVRERVAAAPMAAPSDRHRSPLRPPQIEGYLRKQGGSRSGKGQQWRRRRASGHPSPRPSAARRMQASRSPAERTRARAGTLHSAARRYTTTGTASSRSNRRALSS